MFPFHREEILRSQATERERMDRDSHVLYDLRALHVAAPRFHRSVTRRLAAAFAAYAAGGSAADQRPSTKAAPCPDAQEAMST